MDYTKLLYRHGKNVAPSAEELAELEELLRNLSKMRAIDNHLDDLYEPLLVVGKLRLKQFRPYIEAFLHSRDTETVCLVIQILCAEWNDTENYLETLISFALGKRWDTEDDVRSSAITSLGNYYCKTIGEALSERTRLLDEQSQSPTKQPSANGMPDFNLPLDKRRYHEFLQLLVTTASDERVSPDVRTVSYEVMHRICELLNSHLPGNRCSIPDLFTQGQKQLLNYLNNLLVPIRK